MSIIVEQMPAFKRAYKKLHANEQDAVDDAVDEITEDPTIGVEKRNDLAGIFVYKFKFKTKEFLLAYKWDPTSRLLMYIGVHENFYRDLKRGI